MGGPKGVFSFLIDLLLTFGVNHKYLATGENVAARVYAVPEIKKHLIYIKKCKYRYINYHVVKEKKKQTLVKVRI